MLELQAELKAIAVFAICRRPQSDIIGQGGVAEISMHEDKLKQWRYIQALEHIRRRMVQERTEKVDAAWDYGGAGSSAATGTTLPTRSSRLDAR